MNLKQIIRESVRNILNEALINVDDDVNLIYNIFFKKDIDKISKTGYITKKMFLESETDTSILTNEKSIEANEKNPCIIRINNKNISNAYDPIKNIIYMSVNDNALAFTLNNFDGDINRALEYLKNSNQYESFKMEFTEEKIKGSIHHELVHWIDDTFNKQHIKKRIVKRLNSNTKNSKNIPVDSTKMEIQAQIHNIKQLHNKYNHKWDQLTLKDLFNLSPSLNTIHNKLNKPFLKQWLIDLIKRMDREKLLGKNMRLNSDLIN